jgi:zinc transport system permease protein
VILEPLYGLAGLLYEPVFMRRAAVGLLFLTLATSACGVLVVNRRMAFFPDAVGHSVFAGVALALILGSDQQATVLALGLAIGLAITYLSRRGPLAPDTVIGLVFSGAVAMGLALASRQPRAAAGLSRFFLGDALTVTDAQVLALGGLAVGAAVFMASLVNRLTLSAVGPVIGRQGRAAEYLFGAFLAVVVMIAVQAVGVLLVTALLVAPAASGRLAAASFKGMFWISVGLGAAAGQLGLWASYQPSVNASVGASVVLANVLFFVLALALRRLFPVRG